MLLVQIRLSPQVNQSLFYAKSTADKLLLACKLTVCFYILFLNKFDRSRQFYIYVLSCPPQTSQYTLITRLAYFFKTIYLDFITVMN